MWAKKYEILKSIVKREKPPVKKTNCQASALIGIGENTFLFGLLCLHANV